MTDRQRHAFVLLIVAALIAASAVIIATNKTILGLDLKGGVELTYKGEPTKQQPHVDEAAMQRAVDVMDKRVNQLGVTQPSIQTEGSDLIDVQLPDVSNIVQAEKDVGTTAQLYFYDWEANVLTPQGKPALAGLQLQDSTSVTLSQGGSSAPGFSSTGAGALPFYPAVKLASQQPLNLKADGANFQNQFFVFGNPGSSACKAFYASKGEKLQVGVHCLIAGPIQVPVGASAQAVRQNVDVGLTPAELKGSQQLEVKVGTAVLQGWSNSYPGPKYGTPSAGYYVLRDNVALRGNQISNPQASTDPTTSQPDVTFGFSGNGAAIFQRVTNTLAQRGSLLHGLGQTMFQHFAVALDNQLLTVPSIDYNQLPNGITGGGSEISGSFTTTEAQNLATQLRLGALPITLKEISEEQVSSTLGAQALHQGLIAGIVGLAIVVIFLVAYYRVLGVIAVGGLLAYGIYFFALIKLIPITMTLAGIAGMILTIGVAADANIVIFERVKEEIRAGRSVRQGISIGYRKGLTAIIDANVVTIMTAFILFVLATSNVKGFAFTLGIGTFVSLFTAVLATQAILMTLGDSKSIQSPSALGAGTRKRVWHYDFMGASKYFFSMSGVILLIGALAIGGRGLNLGIDFTGGTQLSFGVEHSASVSNMKSLMQTIGQGDATIQAVTSKADGKYGFQIASRYLAPSQYEKLRTEVNSKYGIKGGVDAFNSTSVGPSFGSDVTKSAVIAIIVSLLVISVYVALRFDWKFALPVLIALMHDILISVGVYALTGRQVTTDTVAAILTILGYSMYDTIIVFDRVRENVPRMPRAAFSQIVNRSMSEVLTRSLATTSCTLLPITALLIFGGTTLKDFAFALLIGVASGAYSSIFIASPVLTHWKEREHGYRARRQRITEEFGEVPAYADGGDIDPNKTRGRRLPSLSASPDQAVSASEFEAMKRDLGLEEEQPSRQAGTAVRERPQTRPNPPQPRAERPAEAELEAGSVDTTGAGSDAATEAGSDAAMPPPVTPAPDIAENDGVAEGKSPLSGPRKGSRSRGRRRHGRK